MPPSVSQIDHVTCCPKQIDEKGLIGVSAMFWSKVCKCCVDTLPNLCPFIVDVEIGRNEEIGSSSFVSRRLP